MISPPAVPTHSAFGPVRVWDLPTRLFHWTLALSVFSALGTAWAGGGAMVWHERLGLLTLALLVFRVLWGVVGGRWSRFARFVYGPTTVWRYLRGRGRPEEHLEVGHSPVGSLSVFAVLGMLSVQVATGLVADDEIATTGPLNHLVSTAQGLSATHWHRGAGQWLILGLVAAHVLAIAGYRWRKSLDLVGPMVRGDKILPRGIPASRDNAATRALAVALAVACAMLAVWIDRQAG
jgi:cytochrome b